MVRDAASAIMSADSPTATITTSIAWLPGPPPRSTGLVTNNVATSVVDFARAVTCCPEATDRVFYFAVPVHDPIIPSTICERPIKQSTGDSCLTQHLLSFFKKHDRAGGKPRAEQHARLKMISLENSSATVYQRVPAKLDRRRRRTARHHRRLGLSCVRNSAACWL